MTVKHRVHDYLGFTNQSCMIGLKKKGIMPRTEHHDPVTQVGLVLETGYTSTAHAIELMTLNCHGLTQGWLARKTKENWLASTLRENSSSYTNAWQLTKRFGSAW